MNEPASGTARAAAWLAGALTRWPMAFLGLMMLIGVAINIANVIGRYLFNAPLFWAEEVLVYMMIWAVFIGLPAIVVDNAHLRMDLFYNLMGPRLKRAVDGLMTLLALACGGFGVFYSWQVVTLLAANRQTSVASNVPMALVHAGLLIGFALMLLALVVRPFAQAAAKAPPP